MIYLDFEGFINEKPSLVGYKIDGKFTQLILDVDLSLISEETARIIDQDFYFN